MFTITLSDGSQLEGLALNGNNFISKNEVAETTFAGKLAKVTIDGDADEDEAGVIGEHINMVLVQVKKYGDEYWFVLRDMTAQELRDLKTDARLSYLEMITEDK